MKYTQELYKRAKKIIPGGTQLLSKRPEMHLPNIWPAYYERAKGCEIWDLDGKHYWDVSYMGIGSGILGYADDEVNLAVKKVIDNGSMTTLNCYEEVELAKILCELHPWAQMARFARSGGEAMSIAVRLARARTRNDIILFCGYHGWHDWYLAANLANDVALDGHLLTGLNPLGVPRALQGTAFPFVYNDKKSFLSLIDKYKGKIAAVVMEPIRNHEPIEGFLNLVREVTQREHIVMIFDEITAGWRLNNGGSHLSLGVNPDVAVFGKGMSNGYPMAAIIGTEQVMKMAEETFISSTYWTERIGPVAAITAINKIKKNHVVEYLVTTGESIQQAWKKLAHKHQLNIEVSGMASLAHFSLKGADPLLCKTFFTQLMLERGFLASTAFYVSYAHSQKIIEDYLRAVDEVFAIISKSIKEGNIQQKLNGPICHSGFQRLT